MTTIHLIELLFVELLFCLFNFIFSHSCKMFDFCCKDTNK